MAQRKEHGCWRLFCPYRGFPIGAVQRVGERRLSEQLEIDKIAAAPAFSKMDTQYAQAAQ